MGDRTYKKPKFFKTLALLTVAGQYRILTGFPRFRRFANSYVTILFMSMISPRVFVKASLQFRHGLQEYTFLNQPVSVYGVAGLRWKAFDPTEHVGEEVSLTVDVLSSERYRFQTKATFTSEQTTDSVYLGMHFDLIPETRRKLEALIQREGFYPTSYLRKYPRIPSTEALADMPMRTIVSDPDGELISFDIANLSPSGILICTENPKAAYLNPGSRLSGQVEPRGRNYEDFEFEGLVCRVLQVRQNTSKNILRYLGIRFAHMRKEDKEKFLHVLRSVVLSLQVKK